MKKLTFGMLFLFGFLMFYACNKTETPLEEKVNLEQVLEDYNLNKEVSEQGELISGKIIIQNNDGKMYIAIATDENAVEHTAYFFQPTEGLNLVEDIIENGTVLFLKDQILLRNNVTKEQYSIFMSELSANQNLNGLSVEKNIEAIGMGKTQVKIVNESSVYRTVRPVIVATGSCTCIKNNAPKNCNAGGLGATSCSCCGCSVTCANGYFACCMDLEEEEEEEEGEEGNG